MEKTPGDIIILHKYTKNYDHMLYCSWDVVRDRCNCYFSFLLYLTFYHLSPPPSPRPKNENFKKTVNKTAQNSPKNENSKKMKKEKKNTWRYHFTQVYQKTWSYVVLFLRYGAWQMSLFFILGYFLPFNLPNSLKKTKFQKKWKNAQRYHFTHVYQRWWLDDVWFVGYGMRQMDGQMDGKSDI